MKKNIIFSILLVLSINLNAQHWITLGNGLNFPGRVLYPDIVTNNLFVGGEFWIVDGHPDCSITAWNGTSLDTTFSLNNLGSNPTTSFIRYQSELYATGAFRYSCGKFNNGFCRWNGNCWDSVNIAFRSGQNTGFDEWFCEYNNLLYCVGNFDSVGGNYSPYIVAWDGVNWLPVTRPTNVYNHGFEKCIVFQNELYFPVVSDTVAGVGYGFLKWDGSNWTFAGPGFWGIIHAMAVYNNELYIGGNNFYGGPSDYILKFDGTNFSSVGSEFKGNVFNLKVIENKLFAVGYIDSADGVAIHDNIAVWDGSHWSPFCNDTFNNAVGDIAVFNNELYVTGGFTMINSDTVNNIAKYQGWYLGENDIKKKEGTVEVYPNPASSSITVNYELGITNYELRVMDVYGRVIHTELLAKPSTEIDVSKWSAGVYFYEVKGEQETHRGKFIVQK